MENPWIRDELVPRLEQFGVDLVLNGHDKIYERSLKEGVTYIQVNTGSAPYMVDPEAGYNPYSQVLVGEGNNALFVSVEGCTLTFSARSLDGTVLDEGELTGRCENLQAADAGGHGDAAFAEDVNPGVPEGPEPASGGCAASGSTGWGAFAHGWLLLLVVAALIPARPRRRGLPVTGAG